VQPTKPSGVFPKKHNNQEKTTIPVTDTRENYKKPGKSILSKNTKIKQQPEENQELSKLVSTYATRRKYTEFMETQGAYFNRNEIKINFMTLNNKWRMQHLPETSLKTLKKITIKEEVTTIKIENVKVENKLMNFTGDSARREERDHKRSEITSQLFNSETFEYKGKILTESIFPKFRQKMKEAEFKAWLKNEEDHELEDNELQEFLENERIANAFGQQ